MARSLLDEERFKLQFAGHDTFPLRYGWLKKAYDQVRLVISSDVGDSRSIFTDDSAIAVFGVGRNMVTAIRHWCLATGVLMHDEDSQQRQGRLIPTALGDTIFGENGDPYLEHPASLWMLHWQLTSNPERSTTWYWAFNELNEPAVDRDLLTLRLLRRIDGLREAGRMKESRISEVTVRRDVECFVRTYLTKSPTGKGAHEDNLESPLAELGLLQPLGVGSAFAFRRGPKPTLPDEVFLYGLHSFWTELYPTRREFSVEAVTHEPGSPGRVFMLDEESVADRLAALSDLTQGGIRWDESTGMRQVYAYDISSVDPLSHVAKLISAPSRRRVA